MSRSVFSDREAASIVDQTVTDYRNRGYTRTTAIQMAADALRLTARRVKSVIYDEPLAMVAREHAEIRAAYLLHLQEEAENLERRSAEVRQRKAELARQYAEMDMGGDLPVAIYPRRQLGKQVVA